MPLHEGQIVTGRIIEFVGTGAKIALSPHLYAFLKSKNLSWKRKFGQDAKDYFDLDSEVLLKILKIENRQIKNAGIQLKPHILVGFRETEPDPWEQAIQLHPPQSKTRGVVCFHLPFGVMVELPTGFEAFVYKKEIARDRRIKVEDFPKIGVGVDLIIQEIDSVKRKISASIRLAAPNPNSELASRVQPLERTTGIVKSHLPFGLIVELPTGFEAFVHETEISWDRKIKAEDFPKIGVSVNLVILKIDTEKSRISASIKLTAPNPYSELAASVEPLETTTGIVKSRIEYGYFVRLSTGAVGLIHKTRLPERLKDAFCIGDEIHVRILAIDAVSNRVTLELDLERYYSDWSSDTENVFPAGKIPQPAKFSEGTSRIVTVNHYERNPAARRTCIEYHGVSCAVCGYSFAQAFGSLGEGFIHVHHLNPVSEQEGEYTLDPVRDMRPVCPNCHAMIHKRRPPYSIEELRLVFSKNVNVGKTVQTKAQKPNMPITE